MALLLVIQRSMYLLINLAQNDNGTSEVEMLALPCRDIEDLAQQVALKHYAREQARLAMRS
jgi:hypothetical protein